MFDKAFFVRDSIKNNANLECWLSCLRKKADEYKNSEVAQITKADYDRYYTDGNRLIGENKYFDRRGRLSTYALMVFIYRQEEYIKYLEDIINIICDEFTWVLPAHLPQDKDMEVIDLFAAETGAALSEIKYLLGDELSDEVKERIHCEVKKRIINNYTKDGAYYGWFDATHNWAAVCSASSAITCLYEGDDKEKECAIKTTTEIMKNFLSGFSNDGICLEGYSYWKYGFGFFLMYADIIYDVTDGKIDYFSNEIVHKTARFANNGVIRSGEPIAFADAYMEEGISMGYEYYLSAKYDDITVSDGNWEYYDSDSCYRWGKLVRTFVWVTYYKDKVKKESHHKNCSNYYPDAGWYIRKTPKYILCAKAGNNGEPHNHNDVASFYIDDYSKQILSDFGSGEYVRDYFSDKRYDFFVCGSQGHNLPIINGKMQKAGKEHYGKVLTATDNVMCIEAGQAYDIDGLESFKRTLEFFDAEIVLIDEFEGDVYEICERFITLEKVEVKKNGFKIGSVDFETDSMPIIDTVEYNKHNGEIAYANKIDFYLKEKQFKMRVIFH